MSRGGQRESFGLMDYEYDNKHGPVDPQSPFLTSTPARRSGALNPTAPNPFLAQAHATPQFHRGPPQSHLDSPSKRGFAATPSASKPFPSIPPHVSSAWTPRTPAADYDFSSGGETPTTPAHDSDAATPDTHMAGKMKLLMDSPSPKKSSRRQSIFRALKSFGSPSPAKESRESRESREARETRDMKELEKHVARKHYTDKLENRVAKRRSIRSDRSKKKRSVGLDNNDDDDDVESDAEVAQAHNPSTPPQPYTASIAGFFHWLEAHPALPAVLSYYLQFLVNTILTLAFVYALYLVWTAISSDITVESTKHQSELMVEIAACVKNYRENRCEPDTRVPAMEMACGNWETCMGRDPQRLARASVGVRAFAKIVNGFFDEFSYKAMVS